jgi:hypothetical protein
MPVVFVPGKGNIQFPDDMTPYQIQLTIEREIIPNRKPDTISAPKQPESTIWNAIKGIGADLAAAPSAFLATVQDISAGDIAEFATGKKGVGAAIDAVFPDIYGPDRAERAARAERFGAVAARTPEKQAALSARARAEAAAPNIESPVGRMAYIAASSLAQNAPGIIASVATGNPIPAVANIGAITFPEAYQRYEERGGAPQEALTGATAETVTEIATEMLPLGVVVKQLGKVGFGKFLKEFLGRELIGEEIATITQGAIDTAIANPDKTWGDYVNELPMQMVETAGSTLLTGGALAGAGAIAKRITGAQEPTEEAPAAKRAAEQAPPPPPPADFAQKLGEVGSKIILNEPGGANEYIYRGMDEGGRVIIEAEDGSMFAEDPAEINAAIDVGAVVPTEPFVPGVAFGEPVADEAAALAAKVDAREVDFNARLDAEEAKLNELREEALRLKAEAENKPVSQPEPAPASGGGFRIENGRKVFKFSDELDEDAAPSASAPAPEPKGKPISSFTAEVEEPAGKPISSFAPAPMTVQTLPQQLLMAAREQPGGLIPAGSLSQPEVMALEEAGIPKNESGDYEAYALIDEADRRYKIGEIDNSMSQYDNSHISGLQQRYGVEVAPAPAPPAESIAPPEQMPIDEDVGPYMQEYDRFRTSAQKSQIENDARKIAAARGAQSVSKEDMFKAATAFDDARFKTPEKPKEKFTIQPLPPAPAPAAPRAVGNKATVTIPATRNKVEVQDELLDLADVKFAEGELQNRDRSRPQTQQFLRRFTSEFDPEGLGEDRSTDRGAPIINKDNVILSGNGRTMGLEEIYEKYPEQAEKYRQFLRDNGWNIEGIERPFLARRLLSDVDEREFVTGSNEADIAALSPPEQAAQDAQDILKPAVLAKYNGGDLKAAKNDAFVSAFLAEMSPQQRENAMDDKGNISSQALKRIENALLYKAYGQAGRASNIFISKAMERSDDDTKTLTNALVDVAKDWIKFQQAVKNGEVDKKYDITGKLMETVGTVSDIKTSGNSVSGALRSEDMITPMDPFVKEILMAFHNDNLTRMLSKKAIAEKLQSYTDIAANQQAEPDMFGKAETPSARDIWKRVDAGEGVQQPELYQIKPAQAEDAATLKETIDRQPGETAAEKVFSLAKAQYDQTPKKDIIDQITPYDAQYETIRSTPGMNVERMANMVGWQIYGDPTNMGQTCIKEVLQNSFDATRSAINDGQIEQGKIEVSVSTDGRTLTVKDNGTGMTPGILGGKFLEIAGTAKEGEKNAGGFGIAKMLFLYANKNVRVITARDGKVAELEVTGDRLFSSLGNPENAPYINVREIQATDSDLFPNGHGTVIQLTLHETIKEKGRTFDIKPLPGYVHSATPLVRSPLFANIDVTFVDEHYKDLPDTVEIGSNFPIQDYTQFVGVKFPWGTAKVYVTRNQTGQKYGDNMHILSNGLWQFSTIVQTDPSKVYGNPVPYTFYVDIVPSVKPDEYGYPFDFNRQGFTEEGKADFRKVKDYIDAIYAYKSRAGEATSFGSIQYFGADGKLGPVIDLTPDIPAQDTAFTRISEGDEITLNADGDLLVNGKLMPELTPDQLKSGIPSASELKVDPSMINFDAVMVHDNTSVVTVGGNNKTPPYISEFMRDKFGERFDEYMNYVGGTFMKLRQEVSRVMNYPDLLNEAVGISMDPEYRGVSITIPFGGSFVNPLVPEFDGPFEAGYGLFGTMIHELAHHKVRSHDHRFPAEMQRILLKMKSDKVFPFQQFEDNFADTIAADYSDIIKAGVELFNGKNPNISIEYRGNRFKDGSPESTSKGVRARKAEGDVGAGGAGGTGQPVLSGSGQGGRGPAKRGEDRTPSEAAGKSLSPERQAERVFRTLIDGDVAKMKQAIAEAQKPDNKIMDERADIQKKNRGCD